MVNLEKYIIANVKQPRDFRTCFLIVFCLVKLLGESSIKICQNIDIVILLSSVGYILVKYIPLWSHRWLQ